jgi:ParB-like chromosome segregation protein Spo0J
MRGSLQSYGIDAIHVPDRLRPLREDRIAMLVDSIAELGLQTPITVCIHERVNIPGEGEVWEVPVLVAGRHRLEATRRLGLSDIACMVVQADADHCRLWEIDENLARAELTATEEAEHLAERKKVWGGLRRRLVVQLAPAASQTVGAQALSIRSSLRLTPLRRLAATSRRSPAPFVAPKPSATTPARCWSAPTLIPAPTSIV